MGTKIVLDPQQNTHSVTVVVFDWDNRSASAHVAITVFSNELVIGLIVGVVVIVIAIPILRKR